MYWFRKLSVASCLFTFNANIFAASEVEPTDRWSQELACYEIAYNDSRQYFSEPVDEARVPSNAIFLGVRDGYRRYKLPETEAYLFGVTSAEQRKELMEKIDFLFRLIYSCGQQYFVKPMDVKSKDLLQKEIAPTAEGFYGIAKMLGAIANRLKNLDYVDERELNSLFTFINGAIDELNKSKSSKDLIHLLCIPIKEWITDSFPVSSMLKYIETRREGDLSISASGGYNVPLGCAFRSAMYFNEYHSKTPEYKKITEWLDGPKLGAVKEDQKIMADYELKKFEREIAIPFDQSQLPVEIENDDLIAAFIRYVESIHQKGEALLEKWIGIVDAEKEEAECLVQERAAARGMKAAKPKKIDPKEALAVMMKDLGLDEKDQSKKASCKAKKDDAKKTKPSPKESKAAIERQRQEAERARELREAEEAERLAQLEEIKRHNAKRNLAAESRQAELRERREQERHNREMIMDGLQQRRMNWIGALYAETQKLRKYNSSELIDPSIFRGQPDYKTVSNALKAAGVYMKERVHGNEKCVAMWKDQNGNNVIVWFDDPHGAQLIKGAAAGWVISLHKALRNSGRLRSE